MEKIIAQYFSEGAAYLCDVGSKIDLETVTGWLDEINATYSTAKEGFCCGGNYIYVDFMEVDRFG